MECTIFLVNPSLANINKLEYVLRIIANVENTVCPNLNQKQTLLGLFIVIAKANLIVKSTPLNPIGTSVGIIGMRGSNASSPRKSQLKMLSSTTFFIKFLMTNRVPLRSRMGFN